MKKTTLYSVHEKLGAKIVEFAGYLMPIQYSSIIAEHNAVRNSVGVFDVSHMGEIFVTGKKAIDFVQYITVNDVSRLLINWGVARTRGHGVTLSAGARVFVDRKPGFCRGSPDHLLVDIREMSCKATMKSVFRSTAVLEMFLMMR